MNVKSIAVLFPVAVALLTGALLAPAPSSAALLADTILPRGSSIAESSIVSGAGNTAVLTDYRRGYGSSRHVVQVRVRAGAGAWSAPISLPTPGEWQLVGVDAAGRFVALGWQRRERVLALGSGAGVDIVPVPAKTQVDEPNGVAVSADGAVVVAGCQDVDRDGTGQPTVATRTPEGVWTAPVLVGEPDPSGCAVLDVDIAPQGAAVAYLAGGQGKLRTAIGSGSQWSAPVALPVAAGWMAGALALARTSDGGARVAWFDSLPRMATLRADGSLAGVATRSLPEGARPERHPGSSSLAYYHEIAVAVAPSGLTAAVWRAGRDGRLLATVARPGETAWPPIEVAVRAARTGEPWPSGAPKVTLSDAGEVMAIAQISNLGPGGVPIAVVAATRVPGGGWLAPRVLAISRRLAPQWESRGETDVRVPSRVASASLLPLLLDTQAIRSRTKARRAAPEARDVNAVAAPKAPRVRVRPLVTSARRWARNGQLRFRCSVAEGGECVVTRVALPPAEARRLRVGVCPRTALMHRLFEHQAGVWVPRGGSRIIRVDGAGASRAMKRYRRALGRWVRRPCDWPYPFLMRKLAQGRAAAVDVTVRVLSEGRSVHSRTFRLRLRGS